MFRFLPEQGSDFAHIVDGANYLITDISVFFTVVIVGSMLYFAVKYRRRDGVDHETPQIEGNNALEILWTVIPSIICVIVAVYGYYGFNKLREVPDGALEVSVTGKQWAWSFKYANGKEVAEEFVVPVDRAVKLVMTSQDVLHSFFVPGMRTKMDVIPQRYTYEWFRPIKTGLYQVYCTEYCGTMHSGMLARMRVVSEAEYERWVNDKGGGAKPADLGRQLYSVKGCNSCHSLDGSRLVGPSFLNVAGRKAKWDDGKEYVADEEYLREAILNSQVHIVEGYPKPSPMPVYEGLITPEEVGNLIAFLKTVKGEIVAPTPAPKVDLASLSPSDRGKLLYQSKACIGCHSLDGSKVVGPSFKGLYGKTEQFDDGSSGQADDAYLKDSILHPQAKIVTGFARPSPMPAYEGQLNDQELGDIIEYLKSLK